jgi:1,4-alpha-glucan branching enzyme
MPEETTLQRADDDGKWHLTMPLEKGMYRYRLVVDGQWQQDPYNDWIEMNPYGEFNSVLDVQ